MEGRWAGGVFSVIVVGVGGVRVVIEWRDIIMEFCHCSKLSDRYQCIGGSMNSRANDSQHLVCC